MTAKKKRKKGLATEVWYVQKSFRYHISPRFFRSSNGLVLPGLRWFVQCRDNVAVCVCVG
jgi:hypothetical protein